MMSNFLNKNTLTLTALSLGLAFAGTGFASANADTISTESTTPLKVVSYSQVMAEGGAGRTIGKWVYQYTAGPYALFKNSSTGDWKYVQIVSTTTYTITVIFDGVARTLHL